MNTQRPSGPCAGRALVFWRGATCCWRTIGEREKQWRCAPCRVGGVSTQPSERSARQNCVIHVTWAVKPPAARYTREQIVAAPPAAYEDYKLREQFGLAHARYNRYPESSRARLLVSKLDVLKGRVLCGEPATFDY